MKITEMLKKESIALGVTLGSKEEAIDRLVSLMDAGGRLKDKAGYKEGILAREALGSTAVGDGIAIPHAKVDAVKEPGLAAITVPAGVDYEAFDGSLANLIFMIAAPAEGADVHLEALANLSTLLMNPGFKEKLLAAENPEAFLQVIDEAEGSRFGEKKEEKMPEQEGEGQKAAENTGYRVLCVTACPTGIAHTYMAAENLENVGKKLGIPVKAETNGSGGAANVLTPDEIRNAEAIIIAADKNVDMARFDGKPVLMVPVADGIHKGEELVKKAVSGTVPIYHAQAGSTETAAKSVDAIMFVHDGHAGVTDSDLALMKKYLALKLPMIIAYTKTDIMPKENIVSDAKILYEGGITCDVYPVSARKGTNIQKLVKALVALVPEGERVIAEDIVSDKSEKFMLAEIMREKILLKFDKEIPHGIAIVINKFERQENGVYDVNLDIICEKASHKAILIGKQGAAIKEVSSFARKDMEKFLGGKVFLTTYVKVKEDWRDRPGLVKDYGYEAKKD